MTTLTFVAAQLGVALFGAPAFFQSSIRQFPFVARFSAAFLLGHVILTSHATFLSLAGIRWTILTIAVPLVVVAIVLGVLASRLPRPPRLGDGATGRLGENSSPRRPVAPSPHLGGWSGLAVVVAGVAVAHLGLRLITGRASSVDYLYFWGVKAVRFLNHGGIESEFLRSVWSIHTHPNYPQLLPISLAWGGLISGLIPWLGAILTSLLWLLIGVPLLFAILRLRLERASATVVTSFWTTAMAIALAHSESGANAEAMLLVCETIALAAVLVEWPDAPARLRWLAGIALAGAVLTKVEGAVAWILILGGVIARDLLWKKSDWLRKAVPLVLWPGLTLGLWMVFELMYGVPLRDGSREGGLAIHLQQFGTVFASMMRHSNAGSFSIPWLIALVGIVLFIRKAISVLPGLVVGIGLLAVFMAHYLQLSYEPAILIAWTFPRISLPAMSALILSSGILSFGGTRQPS